MKWIVEIAKNSVKIINDNQYSAIYEVKDGWFAGVDKVDDFFLVSLSKGSNETVKHKIHLCMLPANDSSVIWKNINDLYRSYDTK